MLFKKPTFYLAVAGVAATIAMVARLNGQSPVKPPPIEPSPKPYEISVAASGTRVLQVIYSFERPKDRPVYVGQQVDLFVKSDIAAVVTKSQLAPQFARK